MSRVGCGQITWRGVPEPVALAEIREAGYQGAVPRFWPGRDPAEAAALLSRCGLEAAPPYFSAPLWRCQERESILAAAADAAAFARRLGCTELYVAAGGDYVAASGRSRREAAGHVEAKDGLTEPELRCLADTLTMIGEAALAQGVRACFHGHVGTVVETEAELEQLLELTDAAVVFLGPDTGHLAWAGADPVAFCARHRARIPTVHLKDIDEEVRRRGAAAGWDYDAFCRHGIFTELGAGSVDLFGVVAALGGPAFPGWWVVETDVPRAPSPSQSAIQSRAHLRSLGL